MKDTDMRLLCIGDSNTYGYDPSSYFGGRYPACVRWTDNLDGWEVVNCGMNGLSIPADGKVWRNLIESKNPNLITIMLGSNDLLEGRSAAAAAERMETFLKTILDNWKSVLLIAPPPMKPGAWVQSESQIRESGRLCQLYRDQADKLGIDFADAGDWNVELSFDGVHFTEAGHEAFAEGLKNHLKEKYHES